MRRTAALLIMILVLAACASSEGMESGVAAVTTTAADDGVGGFTRSAPGEVEVALEEIDDREVIRRASLQLHSADTREAFDEIVRLTESVGGFVADANVFPSEGDEDSQPDVALTVRIPAEQLTPTMKAIKDSVDRVVSESQGAQDVTDQFVDLEARLRNLRTLEVELRALLEEVRQQRDADPQKLLTVFNELSSVRGQIEQIQGQLNVLADLTALATLDVQISQTPRTAPIVEQPWEPTVAAREALTRLVASLQTAADWAINLALFVLPMLLLTIGLPATAGYFLYRRFFRKADGLSAREATPAES